MKYRHIIPILLTMGALFLNGFKGEAQNRTAEIISLDQEVCMDGQYEIKIKFSVGGTYHCILRALDTTDNSVKYSQENSIFVDNAENTYTYNLYFPAYLVEGPRADVTRLRLGVYDIYDEHGVSVNINENTFPIITSHIMPAPYAGDDITQCGFSVALMPTPGTKETGTTFQWASGSSGSFEPGEAGSTTFRAAPGNYDLEFIQTNGPCVASDVVKVTLNGSPTGSISTNSEVCGTGEATLRVNLGGNGPWDITYSDGTNTFQKNTNDSVYSWAHPSNVAGGTEFKLDRITDVNNCETIPEKDNTATVVDITPTVEAGEGGEVCGSQITLSAETPSLGSGVWSADTGSFDYASDTTYSNPAYGEHTLTWTVTNGDCAAAETVVVTLWEQPVANAGPDATLYMKDEYQMQAVALQVGVGVWTLGSGTGVIADTLDYQTVVTGLKIGPSSTFYWTVTNGSCPSSTATITITVIGLKHYTGISPNGDGSNQKFIIEGAPFIENNELIVFNQAGEVVYKTEDYDNTWEGKDQSGNPLPDGYYYFVFSAPGIDPIKDFLVIKRSTR